MTTQAVFNADLDRFNAALAPWVITFEDGWQGLSMDAPLELTEPYKGLLCYGYANGLL